MRICLITIDGYRKCTRNGAAYQSDIIIKVIDGTQQTVKIPSTCKIHDNPESSEFIITRSEENSIEDDGMVITRHRQVFSGKRNGIHGEPVMMEDKQIGDRKTRTKIPVSRFRQTVERVKAERREARERTDHESHIPVRRSSIPKPVKVQQDHKHAPMTVKKEIIITKTEIRKEATEPTVSKIEVRKKMEPRISKIEFRNEISEPTSVRTEIINPVDAPEDEFDKIYAEIAVDTPTEVIIDESLLSPNVEDPERLEIKFDEIIHDYKEHKAEPIDAEVVRRSKIPFLKRRSQQDAELNAQAERTSKIIAARDKLRLRHSLTKSGDFEDELDKELNQTANNPDANNEKSSENVPKSDTKIEKEIEHEIVSSPTSKTEVRREFTKTVSTSSSNRNENVSSSTMVETSIVKEVSTDESTDKKESRQHFMTEENVIKGSVKIGIPVCDSFVHEFTEKNETAKTVEVKRVLSYTPKGEEPSVNYNKFNDEITETKIGVENNLERQVSKSNYSKVDAAASENTDDKDKSMNKDKNKKIYVHEPLKFKDINAENEVRLRSKVDKLITKIDSKESIEIESNKRESINELTKKKSVLSKIAMFEKKETEEPLLTKIPRKETRLQKLVTKDWQKIEHVHVHTPLIVDEVFKPFQADIDLKNEHDKEENPSKSNPGFESIVTTERVILESPNTVYYATENKVQIESKVTKENKPNEEIIPLQSNIDTEYTAQKVEIATITNLKPSKMSTITNDLQGKDFTNKVEEKLTRLDSYTKLGLTKELQAPVIIPGFKPVSEILRSFETNKELQRSSPKRALSKIEYTFTEIETPKVKRSTSTMVEIGTPKYKTLEDTNIPKIPKANETNDRNEANYNNNEGKDSINDTNETYGNKNETDGNKNETDGNKNETVDDKNETYDDFGSVNDYKSLDDVFSRDSDFYKLKLRHEDEMRRAKSLAELDLGDAVKGKVNNMILRMKSIDRIELDRREIINKKEMPRKRSVSEKIALFEGKLTPSKGETLSFSVYKSPNSDSTRTTEQKLVKQSVEETSTDDPVTDNAGGTTVEVTGDTTEQTTESQDPEVTKKIEELRSAKKKYGTVANMPKLELSNGITMPVIAVGTALLDPRLTPHIISAAIDLGYRAIDTAYIYGTEKEVGEGIRAKIADGTVKREDLFIISKLWSTFHRTDLVEEACRASLAALGLEYFDLFLIHNPMSFKEGGSPIPKIATVIQYSIFDYLDAWYGMEQLVSKGLVRAIGVSNFNSIQLQRVLDKGRVKPVVNQVECHPYLSQQRLGLFCSERKVALSCYGTLGSKGTPLEFKSGPTAAIDDPLVQVMASGLGISPAQLLLSYQLENDRAVVVKSSTGAHLWDNLQALSVNLTSAQVDAMHALNRNKRTFTFKGMGDTHRNYPFNVAY